MNNLQRVIESIENFVKYNILQKNKETFFLICLIIFPILTRLIPLSFITTTTVLGFLLYFLNHFYIYVNNIADTENKRINLTEYSWGFVKSPNENLNLKNFINFLKEQKWEFYKTYLKENRENIIFLGFLFGDLVVAFKNLPLDITGAYFAMSIFTKFVFVGYVYVNNRYSKVLEENLSTDDMETKILDTFYKHFNGLVSLAFVLFILFFTMGKFFMEIFFGFSYIPYQTSLSFILLANIFLTLVLIIFRTSLILDQNRTWSLLKVFIPFFAILFVFQNINHPDTIAFFCIGSAAVLSIFLYNFCIRKPVYIENTYNHLF